MSRFILRYQGEGDAPKADVEEILHRSGVRMVDTATRMVLVEAEEKQVRGLVEKLRDWVFIPEKTVPLPDSRLRIRKKPNS